MLQLLAPLTVGDVIYASLLAFFLTWVITKMTQTVKMVVRFPIEYDYTQGDLKKLLPKCYALFPRKMITFHGETFIRGMQLRITTIQSTIIEGQLLGINHDNMLCLLTPRKVVAQKIDGISDIVQLGGNI